jgi:hypothetical protein
MANANRHPLRGAFWPQSISRQGIPNYESSGVAVLDDFIAGFHLLSHNLMAIMPIAAAAWPMQDGDK